VKADARGRFQSRPLDIHVKDVVFATVDWQNFPYTAPAYDGANQLQLNVQPGNLRLHVFDTTEVAPNGIAYMAHHIALSSEGETLTCIERIVIENPSKKNVYRAGKRARHNGLEHSLKAPRT
jgi:hypothetical protein